jgi:hypothetical protein
MPNVFIGIAIIGLVLVVPATIHYIWHRASQRNIRGRLGRITLMAFQVGDRVRFKPGLLPLASSLWQDLTGTVVSIEGPLPGRGDSLFAEVQMDNGTLQRGVNISSLVAAAE